MRAQLNWSIFPLSEATDVWVKDKVIQNSEDGLPYVCFHRKRRGGQRAIGANHLKEGATKRYIHQVPSKTKR